MAHGSTHESGRLPYYLPPGGSSPIGALGYVEAALELAAQVDAGEIPEPAHIVAPVGSGGTVAGMLLGYGSPVCEPASSRWSSTTPCRWGSVRSGSGGTLRIVTAATRCRPRRHRPAFGAATVTREYLGPGYGYATAEGRAAQRVGHEFGIPLDPVYTAKAFAGLLEIDAHTRGGDGPIVMLDTFGPRPD